MTIRVSKDVENAISAAVRSGRFASAEAMIDKLVRDYTSRHPVQPAHQATDANSGEESPDPVWGLMREDTELMDEVVADAYLHRREDKWREFDL